MKTILFCCIFGLLMYSEPLAAQTILTDYPAALDQAKLEKKDLLFIFTNSDELNSMSEKFEDNFLNSEQLKALEARYVLLQIDCNNSGTANEYCTRLMRAYNPDRVFPAVCPEKIRAKDNSQLQTNFSKSATNKYFKFLKTY